MADTGTNLAFIVGMTTFLIMVSILEASFASSGGIILSGAPQKFSPPSCSPGFIIIDGMIGCAWNYFALFLALFSVSSEFAILNSFVLVIYGFGTAWAIASLLRGGGG